MLKTIVRFFRRLPGSYRWLALLLTLYTILVTFYNLSTPLFEAPDAYYHFAVIDHIARTGEFPPKSNAIGQPWKQAVFHAPLYHLVSALLIRPFDTEGFTSQYPENPHVQIGEPNAVDNRNFVAHVGDPWRDTGLAVRVVRGFSAVLGAVTLVSVFLLARGIFPKQRRFALLAVLIVMFNPQFLFMSAVVNNDNLVTALSTAALGLLVWIIRRGATRRRVLILSIMLALNSLAKASGLTLYPVVLVGLTWVGWRDRRSVTMILRYTAVVILIWLLVAGWWYLQNLVMYGDMAATNKIAEVTGQRSGSVGDIDVIGELRGLYFSFWGLFGWFNVSSPQSFYAWTVMMVVLAGAGIITRLFRQHFVTDNLIISGLMVSYVVLVVASWWQFNTIVPAAQGRLWFPLLGILACAIVSGLSAWKRRLVVLLPLSGMGVASASIPLLLIAPAYAPIPQIPVGQWSPPADAVPINMREPWKEEVCLVLWLSSPTWNLDGTTVTIDLAWQTLCSISGYWSTFVHFSDLSLEICEAGDTRHILSQYDSMPGGGNLPLPAFRPGYVVQETISLAPPDEIDRSRSWHLQLGLYDAGGTFVRTAVEVDDGSRSSGIGARKCASDTVNVILP